MSSALRLVLLVVALVVATAISRRRDGAARPLPYLWGFWSHLGRGFTGWNALGAAAAALLTAWFVLGGWDRSLQDVWQEGNPLGPTVPRAVLRYGEWWTVAVAGGLLLVGWLRRSGPARFAGTVAVQAVLAGLLVTLTLKLLTGRRGPASPDHVAPFPKVEDAGDFAFDVWNRVDRDGRFFWPSGHTLSSMVLVMALAAAFPRVRWIPWVGYPLVAFMALAMVDGDFHWTSDVLAAVLIAYPLGRTIGSNLRAAA